MKRRLLINGFPSISKSFSSINAGMTKQDYFLRRFECNVGYMEIKHLLPVIAMNILGPRPKPVVSKNCLAAYRRLEARSNDATEMPKYCWYFINKAFVIIIWWKSLNWRPRITMISFLEHSWFTAVRDPSYLTHAIHSQRSFHELIFRFISIAPSILFLLSAPIRIFFLRGEVKRVDGRPLLYSKLVCCILGSWVTC